VSAQLQSLSPREHHILQLLADGRTNKEIARGLGIAPETVKTHVSKIFGKLGAQNRAQAVAMVMGG
jgi:LuxR family maltose regulon positive regulatory protein